MEIENYYRNIDDAKKNWYIAPVAHICFVVIYVSLSVKHLIRLENVYKIYI